MELKELLKVAKEGDTIYRLDYDRVQSANILNIVGNRILIDKGNNNVELISPIDNGWELTRRAAVNFRKKMLNDWMKKLDQLEADL